MGYKVLVLTTWFPSILSPGSGVFIDEQSRELNKVHDLTVLVPRDVGWWKPGLLMTMAGNREVCDGGLNVIHEPAVKFWPRDKNHAAYVFLEACRRGYRRVVDRFGKPDLIHAHLTIPGGWAASRLSGEYGIPYVITEHYERGYIATATGPEQAMMDEAYSRARRIIAVGPFLAEKIRRIAPKADVITIGNLVRTDFFTPADEPRGDRPYRFLNVAMMRRVKGIDLLLDAVKILVDRGVGGFEVVLGGDGEERRNLERQHRELGLSDIVRFEGYLDRASVRDWLRRSDAFVLPSRQETFGIVLGEAMACGLPVISTRSGGPGYTVLPETGVLVETGDPRAIAEAMQSFIEGRHNFDPQVIRESVAARFGPVEFIRQVTAVYAAAIQG